MRQEFPELAAHHYRAIKLWSGSYFAGSVGGAALAPAGEGLGRVHGDPVEAAGP